MPTAPASTTPMSAILSGDVGTPRLLLSRSSLPLSMSHLDGYWILSETDGPRVREDLPAQFKFSELLCLFYPYQEGEALCRRSEVGIEPSNQIAHDLFPVNLIKHLMAPIGVDAMSDVPMPACI